MSQWRVYLSPLAEFVCVHLCVCVPWWPRPWWAAWGFVQDGAPASGLYHYKLSINNNSDLNQNSLQTDRRSPHEAAHSWQSNTTALKLPWSQEFIFQWDNNHSGLTESVSVRCWGRDHSSYLNWNYKVVHKRQEMNESLHINSLTWGSFVLKDFSADLETQHSTQSLSLWVCVLQHFYL